MALKDWKIINNNKWQIIYKDQRPYPVNHLVIISVIPNRYKFQDNKDMSTIKYFYTKSSVLIYAKQYMRTH